MAVQFFQELQFETHVLHATAQVCTPRGFTELNLERNQLSLDQWKLEPDNRDL